MSSLYNFRFFFRVCKVLIMAFRIFFLRFFHIKNHFRVSSVFQATFYRHVVVVVVVCLFCSSVLFFVFCFVFLLLQFLRSF